MANYIEGCVRSILLSTAAVTSICETRISYQKTPQLVTLPCIIYFAVSDPHLPLYMSPDGSKAKSGQRRFQFTCMSNVNTEALALQYEVMNALRWFQGVTSSFTIENISIADMRQHYDDTTEIYANDVDAIVEYFEP